MSSTPAPQSANDFLSIKYWLGPYAIAVSSLYLWGYWGSFDVNILEYIGISEIIKIAIYPIASAFIFFAIGAVLGQTLATPVYLPPGGGAKTAFGKFLRKFSPVFLALYLVAIFILFNRESIEKWRILPPLIAVAAYIPLQSTELLRKELTSDWARSIALFLIATLVPFAYGRGVLEANAVLTGKQFTYVVTELPGLTVATTARVNERPRYVGKANDRYVFFDPVGRSTTLVSTSELKTLSLKKHEPSTNTLPVTPASNAASTTSNPALSAALSASSPAKAAS